MLQKRGVVFDLDGTLVDSYGAIASSLNVARRHFELPELPEATVRKMVGWGLEVLMEKALGADRVEQGVALFRSHYVRIFRQQTRLLPGVAHTLEHLSGRGYPIGVATNKLEGVSRAMLEALGVGHYVTAVRGARDGVRLKPEPDLLLEAIEALGVRTGEAVYVGDMEVDVETGRRAGVDVWVVATGSSSLESLRSAGPARVLDRLQDMLALLEPLAQEGLRPH